MTLYVYIKTNIADLKIDYIEVVLKTGEQVSLNWDYSGKQLTEDGFIERFQDVCFDEDYAIGRIDEVESITIVAVGYYTEENTKNIELAIIEMVFEEGKRICASDIEYACDYKLYFTG